MSLIYHPDKPTGNEKLFMKLTKAYDALTDDTARYTNIPCSSDHAFGMFIVHFGLVISI